MKKILISAFAGLICICTSCNNPAPTTTTTTGDTDNKAQEEKNIAASDVIMKAFQTGDVSGIDSVIADDFVDHTDMGDKNGKDSLKAMVKFVHTNFTDMKFDKVRDAADGDYVYSWITYSGNGNGTMGMPKGPYKFSAIELSKFKDGKAVEHWSFMNSADIAKMMPAPAPPNTKNKADTGKMKK
jgi:predicted SnoaL-like aldol condensation-catalyzing enzyme